jgi:transcriptional regulator with XRE-family HTH domain
MRWKRHGDAGLSKRPEDWGQRERHPLYSTWGGIKSRCSNPDNPRYGSYGGRGITLHPPWSADFMAFATELEAQIGPRPSPKHSLDRINNDGSYVPGNVRWATATEQSRNRRSSLIREGDDKIILALREEGLTPSEIASRLGIKVNAINNFLSGKTYAKRRNPVLDLFVPLSRIKPANENSGRIMSCAYEGCDETEHYGHGYCRKHYKWVYESESHESRKERTCENCGDPLADEVPISTKFCGKACQMRWNRKHGCYTPEAVKANRGTCTVEGCDNPVNAHGMCSKHHMRVWRYGDPNVKKTRARNFCKCVDDGEECGLPVKSQGMCSKHYQRYVVLPKRRAEKAAAPKPEKPAREPRPRREAVHGTEAERARKSAATKAMWAAKGDHLRAAIKEAKTTPEHRAAVAAKSRAHYESEEARKLSGEYAKAYNTPEVRAEKARIMKERWADPEYRERMMQVRAERKRARSEPLSK